METAGKLTPVALCMDDAVQQLWVVDRQAPVFASMGWGWGVTKVGSWFKKLDQGCSVPFRWCHL